MEWWRLAKTWSTWKRNCMDDTGWWVSWWWWGGHGLGQSCSGRSECWGYGIDGRCRVWGSVSLSLDRSGTPHFERCPFQAEVRQVESPILWSEVLQGFWEKAACMWKMSKETTILRSAWSCGGNHKTSECPSENPKHKQLKFKNMLPSSAWTDQVLNTEDMDQNLATTHQAMTEGKAVIDGWCYPHFGICHGLGRPWWTSMPKNTVMMASLSWILSRGLFSVLETRQVTDVCQLFGWRSWPKARSEGHLKVHTLRSWWGPHFVQYRNFEVLRCHHRLWTMIWSFFASCRMNA